MVTLCERHCVFDPRCPKFTPLAFKLPIELRRDLEFRPGISVIWQRNAKAILLTKSLSKAMNVNAILRSYAFSGPCQVAWELRTRDLLFLSALMFFGFLFLEYEQLFTRNTR